MVPYTTKLEVATRKDIDEKLIAAGWVVQDKKQLNFYASLGVAVRDKFSGKQIWTAEGCPKGKSTGMYLDQMDTDPADSILFVDGKACGIAE